MANWIINDISDPVKRERILGLVNDYLGAGATIADKSAAAGETPGVSDVKQPRPSRIPPESDLHEKIADYCRGKGWYFVHSRMDKRSTVGVGCPDFCIAIPGGAALWLECKRKGQKATVAQLAVLAHLHAFGHVARVVDTWEDALKFLEGMPRGQWQTQEALP